MRLLLTLVALTVCPALLGQTTHNVPSANYPTIQAAIDAALDGDAVIVAPGTYVENIDFLGKAITLTSSGAADATTIDGSGCTTGVDSCSVVTCASGEGGGTTLVGFTIVGGLGTVVELDPQGCSGCFTFGGGMFISNASAPTVINCKFAQNFATTDGGGISVRASSHPSIYDCTFESNSTDSSGGGLASSEGSNPTVVHCAFLSNYAAIGSGGGISCLDGDISIQDCEFYSNFAIGGGAIGADNSNLIAVNCVVSGNSAHSGGGFWASGSNTSIVACSITGNVAFSTCAGCGGGQGGGVYLLGVVATIENTILWENVGGEVFDPGGVSSLSYCCIQGSFPGLGNIGLNPQFVDVDGIDNIPGTIDDDLHLLPTSPCINSGNNGNPLLLCWDLNQRPRF